MSPWAAALDDVELSPNEQREFARAERRRRKRLQVLPIPRLAHEFSWRGRRLPARRIRRFGLRLRRPFVDDHPVDAEPITQLSELGGKECLL